MDGIHIRNLRINDAYGTSAYQLLFCIREALLAGKWQEIDKSASSEWTAVANVLLEVSDAAVSSGDPLKINSETGGFTSAMEGQMVSLYASDNGNAGMYTIQSVVDTNTIFIANMTKGTNWVTETGISLKVHNGGIGDDLPNNAYIVFRAPSATGKVLEIYFECTNGYTLKSQCYPKGDYWDTWPSPTGPGTRTVTSYDTVDTEYYGTYYYLNAYLSPDNGSGLYGVIWYNDNYDKTNHGRFLFGELENVGTGDNYPGFISGARDASTLNAALRIHSNYGKIRMLNEVDAQMDFFAVCDKPWNGAVYNSSIEDERTARLMANYHVVKKPVVWGKNAAGGGFPRGNAPWSVTNRWNPDGMALNNDYWYIGEHAVFPREGANDIPPFISW